MITSLQGPVEYKTFLSPGQMFESAEVSGLGNEPLTIARLVQDRLGLLHVTLRTGSGREISAFAAQIEMAVNEGHLIPVPVTSTSIAC